MEGPGRGKYYTLCLGFSNYIYLTGLLMFFFTFIDFNSMLSTKQCKKRQWSLRNPKRRLPQCPQSGASSKDGSVSYHSTIIIYYVSSFLLLCIVERNSAA